VIRTGDQAIVMDPRRHAAPVMAAAAVLVASVAACSSSVFATPTLHEDMPLWASVEVTADPPVAERPVELQLLTLPEGEPLRHTTIPPGTVVRWSEGLSADPYRLVALGGRCQLDVTLPPERQTHVVLHLEPDPCEFEVLADAPPETPSGSVAATVTVRPWEGLLVEAISLDDPREPVPEPAPPDEGGLAQLGPLYPGHYEIRLRRGAEVLETQLVTIADSGPAGDTVTLTLDGRSD
jgi:hypothetical protein